MKKSHILSAAVMLALLASTTPAAALSLGATVQGDASVSTKNSSVSAKSYTTAKQDDRDDDRSDDKGSINAMMQSRMNASMNHWKTWAFNSGITGTVTAKNGNSVTIKTTNGTTYTVDTTNANIRYASGSTIEVGDKLYVQGAVNSNTIVATLIVDGKASTATPTTDEKRSAIAGTVTAKGTNSLTVVSRNGSSYTVDTTNATIWMGKDKNVSVNDITVGDAVVVQGTINASTATATKIYAVHFPQTAANGGIRGTVTAVNGNSFTILVSGGGTYTVNTDSSDFTGPKGKDESMKDIAVGDMVVVSGNINGSIIDATQVSEAKTNRGFFMRIGNFFKHIFGGNKVEVDSDTKASVDR